MNFPCIYQLIWRFANIEGGVCSSFCNLIGMITSWIFNDSTSLNVPILKRPNTIITFDNIIWHINGKLRANLISKDKKIILLEIIWDIIFLIGIYNRIWIENGCIDKWGIIEEKFIYLLLWSARNWWICLVFAWCNVKAIISP